MGDEIVEAYERGHAELAAAWERLAFEDAHRTVLPYLPTRPGLVIDIGAGSGRDAAWFADKGWTVVAVEPAGSLRRLARQLHPFERITWEDDRLPGLARLGRRGIQADLVWLSAVFMHLEPEARRSAFRRLVTLLKPGGRLVITLRHGPAPYDRPMHPVPPEEIERLAIEHGLALRGITRSEDGAGRAGVTWTALVLEQPDDGTGALSLVRGIILQDVKSATYKLALLRVIARIADQSASLARSRDDGVELPLGLVALYWLRMFKRLVESDIPQAPGHRGRTGLGFVKEAFWELGDLSPFELRPGATFAPPRSQMVARAIGDAAATIRNMPARYLTYGDGRPILPTIAGERRPRVGTSDTLSIDPPFLWAFGSTFVPIDLWIALRRLSVWIEPMLVAEWMRLIERYASRQERTVPLETVAEALRWADPRRDTGRVRDIVRRLLEDGKPIHCVWSGRRIRDASEVEIDHCFPFAAWPCDDLWNLMPASARVNLHKRDRLVTPDVLARAQDLIATWWSLAYRDPARPVTARQFEQEALSSLPI